MFGSQKQISTPWKRTYSKSHSTSRGGGDAKDWEWLIACHVTHPACFSLFRSGVFVFDGSYCFSSPEAKETVGTLPGQHSEFSPTNTCCEPTEQTPRYVHSSLSLHIGFYQLHRDNVISSIRAQPCVVTLACVLSKGLCESSWNRQEGRSYTVLYFAQTHSDLGKLETQSFSAILKKVVCVLFICLFITVKCVHLKWNAKL